MNKPKIIKNITRELIDLIRMRTLKFHERMDDVSFENINYLCEQVEILLKENKILRENIFQIEQEAPPDQKWENILSAKLSRAVQDNKKDYLEIVNSINNDIFVITIQKKFGKTPQQLLEQAQIIKSKAVKKLYNFIKINRSIEKKLIEQEKDLKSFTSLKMDSPECILQTHDDLQRTILKLNQLIKIFNISVLKKLIYQLQNYHPSFKEAFEEAWRRGSNAEWKLSLLEKEKKKLENSLSVHKISSSRIYKRK